MGHWRFLYLIFVLLLLLLFVCLWDKVSLSSPGCPGAHSVDQIGLELRDPPASASPVLGLKVCTTTTWLFYFFLSRCCWSWWLVWEILFVCLPLPSMLLGKRSHTVLPLCETWFGFCDSHLAALTCSSVLVPSTPCIYHHRFSYIFKSGTLMPLDLFFCFKNA